MNATTTHAQIRLTRRSPAYWRVTFDNPPLNVMGPEMVREFQALIGTIEADEDVRVVVSTAPSTASSSTTPTSRPDLRT